METLQSESGSVLVQVLIGLAIMSMVGLSAAHIAGDTKRVEIQGDVSTSISQIHLMAIQKARNITLLKSVLSSAGLDLSADTEVTHCLSGGGSNCQNYNSAAYVPINDFTESVPSPGQNTIDNTVDYKLVCSSPSSCETLLLRVTTALSNNEIRRITDLRFGGSSLVDRVALSFACVGSVDNVVTGIDFQSRSAICQGIPIQNNCPNGTPITDLDAGSDPQCASLAQIDCAAGMKSAGLVASQGACL